MHWEYHGHAMGVPRRNGVLALRELHVKGTGIAFEQCLHGDSTDAAIVFSRSS